ncbi:MAG: hypothetical protein ACYCYP_11680 [Leptospirales bacterium]
MRRMMKMMNSLKAIVQKKIVSPALQLGMGVFLAATGLLSAQSFAAGMDDDKYGLSGKTGRVFGGVVVHIQKLASANQTNLLLDLTPMDNQGKPVCQKPTGKLVRVLTGRTVQTHREHSAFVVVEDPSDPLPSHLTVGDCLTVDGNDVDRVSRNPAETENSIQILPSLKKHTIQMIQALSVKLWPENPPQEAHTKRYFPKLLPPHPLLLKQQKA